MKKFVDRREGKPLVVTVPQQTREVMTVEDLGKYLQLHPMTVYRLVKTKVLPHFKIGKGIRFVKEEIDEAIANGAKL